MKTIAIVGAGPGLGRAMSQRFGKDGFQVGLVARDRDKLGGYVNDLERDGVTAGSFPADVTDRAALRAALERMAFELGPIDVLDYHPTPGRESMARPAETTVENTMVQLDYSLLGAIESVQAVLPGMLDRGDGALLFTGGLSSVLPVPSHANCGLALSALRNYTYVLNVGLADRGVYAGMVNVAGIIIGTPSDRGPDDERFARFRVDPRDIADLYFDMASRRDRIEETFGDPEGVANAPWRW